MLKSRLCDYSDAYTSLKETITVAGAGSINEERTTDRNDKQAVVKTHAPFIDCISEIDNIQVDNAKEVDLVMLMYNVIEYSDNHSKIFGSLYQFCSDDPKDPITDSELHKFKSIFLSNTNNAGTINVEVAVPLKCLSNF